jgi:hypothetical protein
MHQGDSGTWDPLLFQVIPDDCVEKGCRTWKISLFEDRLIGV